MPVHGEGSSVWKETSALTDALMESQKYLGLYRQSINTKSVPKLPPLENLVLEVGTATTTDNPPGPHTHEIALEKYQVADLRKGSRLTVTTSEAAAHQHTMVIQFQRHAQRYQIARCGSTSKGPFRCWDKHPAILTVIEKNEG